MSLTPAILLTFECSGKFGLLPSCTHSCTSKSQKDRETETKSDNKYKNENENRFNKASRSIPSSSFTSVPLLSPLQESLLPPHIMGKIRIEIFYAQSWMNYFISK